MLQRNRHNQTEPVTATKGSSNVPLSLPSPIRVPPAAPHKLAITPVHGPNTDCTFFTGSSTSCQPAGWHIRIQTVLKLELESESGSTARVPSGVSVRHSQGCTLAKADMTAAQADS